MNKRQGQRRVNNRTRKRAADRQTRRASAGHRGAACVGVCRVQHAVGQVYRRGVPILGKTRVPGRAAIAGSINGPAIVVRRGQIRRRVIKLDTTQRAPASNPVRPRAGGC